MPLTRDREAPLRNTRQEAAPTKGKQGYFQGILGVFAGLKEGNKKPLKNADLIKNQHLLRGNIGTP
jgi:hypothetical protein